MKSVAEMVGQMVAMGKVLAAQMDAALALSLANCLEAIMVDMLVVVKVDWLDLKLVVELASCSVELSEGT